MTPEELRIQRNIPDVLTDGRGNQIRTAEAFEARKKEILRLLAEEEYGAVPPAPEHFSAEIIETMNNFAAGKAPLTRVMLTAQRGEETFSFPITTVIPAKHDKPLPAFIFINFRADVPDRYAPTEEIADRGYAVFSFCYTDVTSDSDNFRDAGARFLSGGERNINSPGKIAMWAWAAMRVADYAQSLPEIDAKQLAVIGHSRLGKTALYTGANDARFTYVISNDSGCSGAAITRGKKGETKEAITKVFPFWFCPRYNRPTVIEDLSFDQNFLLAAIAPRHIIVGSAEADEWADPESEFLALYMTNPVYALYGKRGLVAPNEIPSAPAYFGEGDSCYQLRHGLHYLSREDWLRYMDFIDAKRAE